MKLRKGMILFVTIRGDESTWDDTVHETYRAKLISTNGYCVDVIAENGKIYKNICPPDYVVSDYKRIRGGKVE